MNHYTSIQSPIGKLFLARTDQGLCSIGLPGLETAFFQQLKKYFPKESFIESPEGLADTISQLGEYFQSKRKAFSVPLDLGTTPFFAQVLKQVQKIPYGATKSYGEIAHELNHPNSARAVGMANARNPIPIIIPCHRVIAGNGALQGYAGGLEMKSFLLRHEGLTL